MRLPPIVAALVLLTACDPAPTASPSASPTTSASPTPSASRTVDRVEGTQAFGDPAALAFDSAGSLWVGNYESGTLARYAAGALATSGVPKAATVVSAPAVKGPNAFVFDLHGYLWVPMYDGGSVAGFTPEDLVAGRAPTVVMAPGGGVLVQPAGVALDADGNLWVSNSGVGHLVRFPRRGGLEAGTAVPDVVLTVPEEDCQAVAVVDGRLWHGCHDTDRIYVYDLAGVSTGTPKPLATLTWPAERRCGPVLFAAAPGGALAAACYDSAAVSVFRPEVGSGTVAETSRVSGPELANVHGVTYDSSGALWAGTNHNVLARWPAGATTPDVVLRPR